MSDDNKNNNEPVNPETTQSKSDWNKKSWKNNPKETEQQSSMPDWKKSLLFKNHFSGRN